MAVQTVIDYTRATITACRPDSPEAATNQQTRGALATRATDWGEAGAVRPQAGRLPTAFRPRARHGDRGQPGVRPRAAEFRVQTVHDALSQP